MVEELPVAIIGAGPVGLAAAAHLAARGLPFVVLEGGPEVGHAVRQWGHVRLFSPWRWTLDRTAGRLLEQAGWRAPDGEALPTGDELVERWLVPLAAHPRLAPALRLNARVIAVGRRDLDKTRSAGRERQPFALQLASGELVEARAVIDASGTWLQPNPMGAGGYPLPGEAAHRERIATGIPGVLGRARQRYAGRRTLVVGSGHSATNTVLDLLRLQDGAPTTRVSWAMRREALATVFGGGEADALPARAALGRRAREAITAGRVELLAPFRIREVKAGDGALLVAGDLGGHAFALATDEAVVATGFRPHLEMLREVRLDLDRWLEAPRALAPLIDPNLHSCGTVPPHGARELAHPEAGFFIVGTKSYGRAPTFLLATGYEQVRSVAAALAGDAAASARVELELPETGVCGGAGGDTCCGGPPAAGIEACCARDAEAKARGAAGCGCHAGA
jgi:thioredoxin reductase